MSSSKKAIRIVARKFRSAIEEAAEALDELVENGDEDILEEIGEDLLVDSRDFDKCSPHFSWLESVAAFVMLQALKIDIAECEEGEEEEEEEEPAPSPPPPPTRGKKS
ncbi:hypothetical protein WCLP8_1580004 [uncultured Gammaproteobacteria bacterium]